MRTYVQPGNDINFQASGNINSGEVLIVGELVGVSTGKYVSGDTGVMEIAGIHKIPKATGTSYGQGDKLWINTTSKLIVTAGGAGTKFLGYAAEASTTALVGKVILARPGE